MVLILPWFLKAKTKATLHICVLGRQYIHLVAFITIGVFCSLNVRSLCNLEGMFYEPWENHADQVSVLLMLRAGLPSMAMMLFSRALLILSSASKLSTLNMCSDSEDAMLLSSLRASGVLKALPTYCIRGQN